MQVILKNVRLHALHGLHKEEFLTGGEFIVNLVASYEPSTLPIVSINETIDYTEIFAIVKERMQFPTGLLETLATEIAETIMKRFAMVDELHITIEKVNAPIVTFQGMVGIRYHTKRNK